MASNNFNLHLSCQGKWFTNRVHICHQYSFQQTCESTNLQPASFIWWGRWWFTLLGTCSLPSHALPSPDTRWCHGSLLECKCVPNNASTVTISHLSQDMFITHSFGPRISVGTRHPGCVMNPSASCLVILCFRWKGLLPPLSSLLLSPMSFTSLHLRSLFFITRNISQQACTQQGPKPQLQRTSHYPSRWCANVAVDIKVFQLIIIRRIHWRQVSLSYNLAPIRGILAKKHRCNAMVTLSWGQLSDTCW